MFEEKTLDLVGAFKRRMLDQGRAEGEAIGEARGEARGRLEGGMEKAMEIARNLLGIGTSADTVSQATGLPLADVQRLAAETR